MSGDTVKAAGEAGMASPVAPGVAEFVAAAVAHGLQMPARLRCEDGVRHEVRGKGGAAGWYSLSFDHEGRALWGAFGMDGHSGVFWEAARAENRRRLHPLARVFLTGPDGVYCWSEPGAAPVRICGPLRLVLRTDLHESGKGGYLMFEYRPAQGGEFRQRLVRCDWLVGDGSELLRCLADASLWLSADASHDVLILQYLRRCAAALPEGD